MPPEEKQSSQPPPNSRHQTLATPAVRHLTKEHNLSLSSIHGTGKDGRILKEDVHRHISESARTSISQADVSPLSPQTAPAQDTPKPLTPVQTAMYRTMTSSLSISHFLYTTPINLTPLTDLRKRLNATLPAKSNLTPLPFILKAISKTFQTHPHLNASLDTSNPKPTLTQHSNHDFGIAVDTPSGLLVPVLRNVHTLSILEISAAVKELAAKAREGRLTREEMQGATFTISNIGAIGGAGGVVSPVIVGPQVGIVGVGRGRVVPVWVEGKGDGKGEDGYWGKREEAVMSWCADHRVVDGAQCARAAEMVSQLLENIEGWVVDMR